MSVGSSGRGGQVEVGVEWAVSTMYCRCVCAYLSMQKFVLNSMNMLNSKYNNILFYSLESGLISAADT